MNESKDILIIGVGNEFRGDDAFGVMVVKTLQYHHEGLAEYIVEQDDLSRLVEIWDNRDVIVIDAVFSDHSNIGKIHMLSSIQLLIADQENHYSSHGLALSDALKMSKVLNKLPSSLLFIGVEGDNWNFSIEISEKVKQMIPVVERRILDYIHDYPLSESHN